MTVNATLTHIGRLRPDEGYTSLYKEVAIAALLLVVAIFTRWHALGDPNYQIDESFYLFAGDAMHHGAVPYVDFWDRKPPGLFVIYWFFASFPDGVRAYQIAALLFATATARAIVFLARQVTNQTGALCAGVTYLAGLDLLLGGGGQAPVFYNLFITSAAVLLFASLGTESRKVLFWRGVLAAMAGGMAISLKPTALPEACFFTAGFVWLLHRSKINLTYLTAAICIYMLAGSVLLLLTIAWYGWQGEIGTIWQACVHSIFLRQSDPPDVQLAIAIEMIKRLGPLLLISFFGLITLVYHRKNVPLMPVLLGWLATAFAGFFAVPGYYLHYALPLLPVLLVLAAPIFSRGWLGGGLAMLITTLALIIGHGFDFSRASRSRDSYYTAVKAIRHQVQGGSLFIISGPPLLYRDVDARRITRFVFPEHLVIANEARSLGTDPRTEIERIFAQQPNVVIKRIPTFRKPNPATQPIIDREIASHYRLVNTLNLLDYGGDYQILVYARNHTRHSAEY